MGVSGALLIELDVKKCNMGDVIDIYPYEGVVKNSAGEVVSTFELSAVLFDKVRASSVISLNIARGLTGRAREALGLEVTDLFATPVDPMFQKRLYLSAKNGR